MTDEKFTFVQDIREKKNIARSAGNRVKRGYRGKRLGLMQENMTHKRWKQMNGEVATYNLKNPMDLNAFNAMPEDLKEDYLSRLRERYNPSSAQLGEMLGVSAATARGVLARHGVPGRGHGGSLSDAESARQRRAWNDFLGKTEENEPDPYSVTEPVTEMPVATETRAAEVGFRISHMELELRGEFCADTLLETLTALIRPGVPVRMKISVEKLGEAQ